MHLSNCICCFHKYQAIWERNRLLQRIDNTNEPNVVRTMKEREVMGHAYVPCKISGCTLFLELVDISSVQETVVILVTHTYKYLWNTIIL